MHRSVEYQGMFPALVVSVAVAGLLLVGVALSAV